jgi:hypothetical protein
VNDHELLGFLYPRHGVSLQSQLLSEESFDAHPTLTSKELDATGVQAQPFARDPVGFKTISTPIALSGQEPIS